jgi:flavin-dependent thymidylate synthase
MALGQNNKVELIGIYGDDFTHACSAWTSTSRDLTNEKRERVGKLLTALAQDGHHSPFEKSALHFLCTTDIATHIQLLKHRIGVSINGESARYKELKGDKFYMPTDWSQRELDEYKEFMEHAFSKYHACVARLEEEYLAKGLTKKQARNRAKESARFYIPYGNQLECDVQFNFRSFYHFVKLRYSAHAQKEVRDVAEDMLVQVRDTKQFDRTLIAFGLMDSETRVLCNPFQ